MERTLLFSLSSSRSRFFTPTILALLVRDRKQHGLVFRAIAAITQLNISRGNVLFQVEPTTKKKHEYCI
jgi:hypothetical protein